MRNRNPTLGAYARAKGKPYAETFRCPGGALCLDFCNSGLGGQPRRQEWINGFADLIDWLEAAAAPLVRDGELRQPHEGAPAPREATSKRLSQAKNSRYHSREFCGLRIQWFSSGKYTSRAGTFFALSVL